MMKLEYVAVAHCEKKRTYCPHNDAVVCERKQCNTCGWNPVVNKARMDKLQTPITEVAHGQE